MLMCGLAKFILFILAFRVLINLISTMHLLCMSSAEGPHPRRMDGLVGDPHRGPGAGGALVQEGHRADSGQVLGQRAGADVIMMLVRGGGNAEAYH